MVQHIHIHDLSYTPPTSAEPLFAGLSATFSTGWTAMLGDNGIGKTTFCRLVAGDLEPDSGDISPASTLAGWIEQQTDRQPSNLDDFAVDWSQEAMRLRTLLNIGDDWPYRWKSLSGGERKKLQVACALSAGPELLIADEPTNHLDMSTRDAVIQALRQFDGIGIVITHDVAVIDNLASRSYLLHRVHAGHRNHTVIDLFAGNWDDISSQLDARNTTQRQQLQRSRQEVRRLTAEQHRRQEKVRQAAAHSLRTPDRKDHDASKRKKFAKGGLDGGVGRSAGQLAGRIADARQAAQGIDVAAKQYTGDIAVNIEPSIRRELLHLDAQFLPFDGDGGLHVDAASYNQAVLDGCRLHIDTVADATGVAIPKISVGPRDRLVITGTNGAGKTTVLNALLNSLDPDVPHLLCPQHTPDADLLLARFADHAATQRQQVIQYFAALNGKPEALRPGTSLSAGERRKLMLALGLVAKPQIMVFDEPTNHLDLSSKQALATLLKEYPGALVIVTHDELLLRELVCS
ncbi:ATP-binding cassette domain-containing protein [Bifidobacterium choloepi]|uniref:ABC-F family ATP-binding cassette domain-containing protein n=1 Tax=Bifidobacterium choloepi TaxID=2614131 RepID=A0A6I5MY54_9BIFI|nr:ATP-binding cassette domain-containing protein [Bifidobacterium choloepi]NEG69197.1 ABC-F family ATP-binding cassette domain-containing protein [Bifidobacterium choloepi]